MEGLFGLVQSVIEKDLRDALEDLNIEFASIRKFSSTQKKALEKVECFLVKGSRPGLCYLGKVRNGQIQGRGLLLLNEKNIKYEGEFWEGLLHGTGVVTHPDFQLEATFSKGRMSFIATLVSRKGKFGNVSLPRKHETVFLGNVEDCFPSGFGSVFSRNEENEQLNYESGNFRKGIKFGFFRNWTPTSHFGFSGNYENDLKMGFGILEDPQLKYSGFWRDDRKDGYGILKTSDHSYEGEFKQDRKDGFGLMRLEGGSAEAYEYLGEFKQDIISGFGKLNQRNEVYFGHFDLNCKSGMGFSTLENGHRYLGFWKSGEKFGLGILSTPEVTVKAEWEKGKINGRALFIRKTDGDQKYCLYENNRLSKTLPIQSSLDFLNEFSTQEFSNFLQDSAVLLERFDRKLQKINEFVSSEKNIVFRDLSLLEMKEAQLLEKKDMIELNACTVKEETLVIEKQALAGLQMSELDFSAVISEMSRQNIAAYTVEPTGRIRPFFSLGEPNEMKSTGHFLSPNLNHNKINHNSFYGLSLAFPDSQNIREGISVSIDEKKISPETEQSPFGMNTSRDNIIKRGFVNAEKESSTKKGDIRNYDNHSIRIASPLIPQRKNVIKSAVRHKRRRERDESNHGKAEVNLLKNVPKDSRVARVGVIYISGIGKVGEKVGRVHRGEPSELDIVTPKKFNDISLISPGIEESTPLTQIADQKDNTKPIRLSLVEIPQLEESIIFQNELEKSENQKENNIQEINSKDHEATQRNLNTFERQDTLKKICSSNLVEKNRKKSKQMGDFSLEQYDVEDNDLPKERTQKSGSDERMDRRNNGIQEASRESHNVKENENIQVSSLIQGDSGLQKDKSGEMMVNSGFSNESKGYPNGQQPSKILKTRSLQQMKPLQLYRLGRNFTNKSDEEEQNEYETNVEKENYLLNLLSAGIEGSDRHRRTTLTQYPLIDFEPDSHETLSKIYVVEPKELVDEDQRIRFDSQEMEDLPDLRPSFDPITSTLNLPSTNRYQGGKQRPRSFHKGQNDS